MPEQILSYPQYRKYKNRRSYFRINSPESFDEIQILGKRHILHSFTVRILPDRNFIHDMTFDYRENWEESSEEEFNSLKSEV